jgi:hypothetical protein
LRDEREAFRRVLTTFNEHHGEPNGIVFAPVGWEDTLGGVGRPQELINEDLRQCDFAVFVFHDRWGSPTGNGTKADRANTTVGAHRVLRHAITPFA